MNEKTYTVGEPAYWRGYWRGYLIGFVPCMVTAIEGKTITIKLTADCNLTGFKRGKVLTFDDIGEVVPRKQTRNGEFFKYVVGGWKWVPAVK